MVSVGAVYTANRYYFAYFETFGLDQVQVGINKTDIVFHLLAYGFPPGAIAFGTILAVQTTFLTLRPMVLGAKVSARQQTRHTLAWTIVVLTVVLFTAFAVIPDLNTAATRNGKDDPAAVVTETRARVYNSDWQRVFGTTIAVVQINWIGPQDLNVFQGDPVFEGTQIRYTNARLLTQTGESTIFYDLHDCEVRSVPTIDLSIIQTLVYQSSSTTTPIALDKACKLPTDSN